MFKYFGFFLILLAAFLINREYKGALERRFRQCEEFCRFVKHVRVKIACYLSPAGEWSSDFSSAELEKCGFLQAASVSSSLSEAFSACEDKLSLGEPEKTVLKNLFSEMGSSYMLDELRVIDRYSAELDKECAKLSGEYTKNIKVINTLTACVSIGAIILFI